MTIAPEIAEKKIHAIQKGCILIAPNDIKIYHVWHKNVCASIAYNMFGIYMW